MTKFIETELDHGIIQRHKILDSGEYRVNLIIPSKHARVCDLFGCDLKPRFQGDKIVLRHTLDDLEDFNKFVQWIITDFVRPEAV